MSYLSSRIQSLRAGQNGYTYLSVTVFSAVVTLLSAVASAIGPAWWTSGQLLLAGENVVKEDYSPANIGQVKTLARKAANAIKSELGEEGAGAVIQQMIDAWEHGSVSAPLADDYAVVTIGQLKTIAKPFYDRLYEVGLRPSSAYPWDGATSAADDYAVANIGQLKALFAFDLSNFTLDSDGDNLPDAWEMVYFGNLTMSDGSIDSDGDGRLDSQERIGGTNPSKADTDSDGWLDGTEFTLGSSATSSSSTPSPAAVQSAIKVECSDGIIQEVWTSRHTPPTPPPNGPTPDPVWATTYLYADYNSAQTFQYVDNTSNTAPTPPVVTPKPPSVVVWGSPILLETASLPLMASTIEYINLSYTRNEDQEYKLRSAYSFYTRLRLKTTVRMPAAMKREYVAILQRQTITAPADGSDHPDFGPLEIVDVSNITLNLGDNQLTGDYQVIPISSGSNCRYQVALMDADFLTAESNRISAPASHHIRREPNGKLEAIIMENADLDQRFNDGPFQLIPAIVDNPNLQDAKRNDAAGGQLSADALNTDNDFVKFFVGGLTGEGGDFSEVVTASLSYSPSSASNIGAENVHIYTKDGARIPISALTITNGVPETGPMKDLFDINRGLYLEIGDLGEATKDQGDAKKKREIILRLSMGFGSGGTITRDLTIRRGGFWRYDRRETYGFSLMNGKGDLQPDKTGETNGNRVQVSLGQAAFGPIYVKSGQGYCDVESKENCGPISANWWYVKKSFALSTKSPNWHGRYQGGVWKRAPNMQIDMSFFPFPVTSLSARAQTHANRLYQGGYSLWPPGMGSSAHSLGTMETWVWDGTDGSPRPTSVAFKYDLAPKWPEAVPVIKGKTTRRSAFQVHPDGHSDGTGGCIGIVDYYDAIYINYLMRHMFGMSLLVQHEPTNDWNRPLSQ